MPLNYKKKYVIAASIINGILYVPLKTVSLLFLIKRRTTKRKILVQDGYRLGDIIMMSRVLFNLKASFRDAEIHFITSADACSLLEHCRWIDKLITYKAPWAFGRGIISPVIHFFSAAFKLSSERYSMAIDFQGDPRGTALLYLSGIPIRYSLNDFHASAFCTRTWSLPKQLVHQVVRYEYLLEKITSSKLPEFDYPLWPQQNMDNQRAFVYQKKKPLIIIHPGASFKERRWSCNNFALLIKLCTEHDLDVILIGSTHDIPLIQEIIEITNLQIKFRTPSFSELEYLLQISDFVVCNDSFAAHASWACRKKTAILFGPGYPHQVAPFTGNSFILWNNKVLTAPFDQWTGVADIDTTQADTVFNTIKNNLAV
ncbi:MAG: glycosyltransferase family 9 protein [Fibrobacter sp.]|nr:glycosyltransferase family 9 protein [Fibrobacter sp.]